MSLLQYGFKRQKISDGLTQEDKQNPKNHQRNLKNSNFNKTFKIKWLSEFPWLHYDSDNKKMFCTLCMKHKMKNKFAAEGAANISKKSAVKEHAKCKDHTDAEKLETAHIQMKSLQNQIFLSDTNVSLIIVVMQVVARILIAIVKTIEDQNWKELSDVVAFGIMIDESTDIITTKHLDIYVSYVTKQGIFKTHFLCLLPLTECDAKSITNVIIDIFLKKGILFKLVAFASDGASIILGKNEDVAAKLSRVCTYPLIVNHCVVYRLALACKDARKEIEFYKKAELLVKKIYGYFKNSCSYIQQLKEIQDLLDCSILKIKRLYEIHWLAWYDAIKNICDSIPALLRIFKDAKNDGGHELYIKLTS
ncbi:hypothetical protein RclHR1_07790007 [Rhizophagus clarus]|uniref:C17orf113 probable zinc finger domain-containing protein n=1 Tax=Rhizophagus clarus TaxID=94130 RepID=A0A2Z6S9W5_9GLOM|nr:hypothetical protein RclHR1_07790007 [Rhizophagus clarus]